ncbi:Hypothetical protein CINCED_3A020614 [Cinara cedri]|uniref:Uncharacterized protein n=1 Tax=Cinara cedri TaxID=506608 RepID=A0A5E4NG22_9HEMI|nr:Hypothetical protein CINCED_3A020614 [Cinara cedri]
MDLNFKTMENVNEITLNPNEIQICKSFTVVNNRINNFLKRKQEECNDRNTRLYCSESKRSYFGSSRTCDTIAAKRQKRSECFVKKTKVHNAIGPLCNGIDPASENSYSLSNHTSFTGPRTDLCERISNLESCLNIKSENSNNYKTTADIYAKLKSIEDKVLTLQNMLLEKNANEALLIKYNSDKKLPTNTSVDVLSKKSVSI